MKLYHRLFDTFVRLWVVWQKLRGVRYPTKPWCVWARFQLKQTRKRNDITSIKDEMKYLVLALMIEDSMWIPVEPPNSHQYLRLVDEIHSADSVCPVSIFTRALKIHHQVLHLEGEADVLKLEQTVSSELSALWPKSASSSSSPEHPCSTF